MFPLDEQALGSRVDIAPMDSVLTMTEIAAHRSRLDEATASKRLSPTPLDTGPGSKPMLRHRRRRAESACHLVENQAPASVSAAKTDLGCSRALAPPEAFGAVTGRERTSLDPTVGSAVTRVDGSPEGVMPDRRAVRWLRERTPPFGPGRTRVQMLQAAGGSGRACQHRAGTRTHPRRGSDSPLLTSRQTLRTSMD
jgi:hypothetical protein